MDEFAPFSASTYISRATFQREGLRRLAGRRVLVAVLLLTIAYAAVELCGLTGAPTSAADRQGTLYLLLAGIAGILLFGFTVWQAAGKSYDRSPGLHAQTEYNFSAEGFTATAGPHSATVLWRQVISLVRSGHYIKLNIGPYQAYWVDSRQLSAEQLSALYRALQEA